MRSLWIKLLFTALFLWWVYLFFTTEMVIVFDSEGYENAGKIIHFQGWYEFLRNGPQREPLFPLLISLSMKLGECWGVSYFYPLKLIGILFLSLTMVFSYRLMKMLSINRVIACLAVFYMGISPVMTNSSMRMWSEFAAYPWVVLAVIWSIKSWRSLETLPDDRRGSFKIAGHALMVAALFLLIMSVKAVAEGVLLFYLWPFYWYILSNWHRGHLSKAKNAILFCLIVLITFEGVVNVYKWVNYRANGHYTFTNRGDWALYGNTARRMQPLTFRRLEAAAAYVPATGLCQAHFSTDECDFWSARHSDDIVFQKRDELSAQGINGEPASRYFIYNSIKMILSNPLQALVLMIIEAHKMFFWESSIAFVAYPNWLERIFYIGPFMNHLKIILAVLSWIGCVFAFCNLCCHCLKPSAANKEQDGALLWVFNFVFWYTAMYSLYFILDRYSFPLISLFMVLIAFFLQKTVRIFIK